MSSAHGREQQSIGLALSPSTLYRHFVYSKDAVRRGRWWTALTYMLCHADYAHLASNTQCLVLCGPAALGILGYPGAIATYAAAGIFGALDLPRLYDLQLERFFATGWRHFWRSVTEPFLSRRHTVPIVKAAAESFGVATRAIDGVATRIANSLATDLASNRRLIGASAGVSAFLMLDACASIEQCVSLVARGSGLEEVAVLLLHALGAAHYFTTEASRTYMGAAPGVDHAAHLNGAACGLIAFAIAKARSLYRRRRRRRDDSSRWKGASPRGV
ncbi:hypothetical protein CTAYLR_010142 [Chrysophaeum taylorii]|uniref:Peptidase S54 rhomboid domain-containing protein n=1 Tax=Chrysophaeum taylorii TaxID=2483200 RepID=A0AAD7XKK9_9STRA|nr:hypothetical protein CTAYLR_010142 [Chrysophaeum taylorii]